MLLLESCGMQWCPWPLRYVTHAFDRVYSKQALSITHITGQQGRLAAIAASDRQVLVAIRIVGQAHAGAVDALGVGRAGSTAHAAVRLDHGP